MNEKLKILSKKLEPAVIAAKKGSGLIFILVFAGIYGFLVLRVQALTQAEPTPDMLAEQLQTIQRPKIDEDAVEKIKQLEDQNIQVQSLFDEARNNPFSE